MIKVGDKFIGIEGREEVVAFIWLYDKTVSVESGLAYSYEEVYKSMYEQQIQRADELEKRWSKLVDVLKKKYEYYKVRADNESFGPIEQEKWRIAKHEMMMVLKIMTDLKRGETE